MQIFYITIKVGAWSRSWIKLRELKFPEPKPTEKAQAPQHMERTLNSSAQACGQFPVVVAV